MVTLCPTAIPGLDLFLNCFDDSFQQRLVEFIDTQLERGRQGKLPGKMYDTPSPIWVEKGQSREMIQYGYYTNSNRVYPGCKVGDMESEPILVEMIEYNVEQDQQKVCLKLKIETPRNPGYYHPIHLKIA